MNISKGIRFAIQTYGIVVIITLGFFATFPAPVEAQSTQLEVTYSFDRAQYFAGDGAKVSLTIKNIDPAYQLKIVRAGIHFDWMQANYYHWSNNEGNPATLGPSQSTTLFNPSYTVPTDASVADHSWNLYVEYQDGGESWMNKSWQSTPIHNFKIVDFSISVSPQVANITASGQATFTVTLDGQN